MRFGNLRELLTAGALSSALAVVRSGGAVAELTLQLSRRYAPAFAAPARSVAALFNRAARSVQLAQMLLPGRVPTLGEIPLMPGAKGKGYIVTRTISSLVVPDPSRPSGSREIYQTTVIRSRSPLTYEEIIRRVRRDLRRVASPEHTNYEFSDWMTQLQNQEPQISVIAIYRPV